MCLIYLSQVDQGYGSGRKKNQEVKETVNNLGFAKPNDKVENVCTKGLFTRTVNVTVFVSGTFDLFDVTCKQHHRIAFNPFLNGTKKW